MHSKSSNFVAVDLGSSKIACVAADINKKGETKIVGQNLHSSKGIKSGIISDLQQVENSVIEAIYELEKTCNKSIKKVSISLSGSGTKSYYINNKIKLVNQTISLQDLRRLVQRSLSHFKIKGQEIIHYFPIEFTLDDNVVENPVGMFGKELGCELHIIAAHSDMLANVINCFAKCHVEVSNIILAVYAASIACLSDDEKKLGALIIDIGDRTTSVGVFVSGKLVYMSHVDLGSFHITSDIAKIFGVDFAVAEKLKILYGNAMLSSFDKDSIINMDDLSESDYTLISAVTIHKLSEIVASRMEEILSMIKKEYDRLDPMIAYRVVITGGGSMLRGVKELATKIFDKQVRIGKPEIVDGFAEGYNPAIYSAAIGAVKIQALKQQKEFYDVTDENTSWLTRCLIWVKENI